MSDKLTDSQVRAELERIDEQEGNVGLGSCLGGLWFDIGFALLKSPKQHRPKMQPLLVADALRLLAESQVALGKIAENKHRDDNEWIRPVKRGYRLRCCDCGLVHDIDFKHIPYGRGRKIIFRARRNNRATAAVRRFMT